jgi:V/A-type H+-transporting ATPase subunit K
MTLEFLNTEAVSLFVGTITSGTFLACVGAIFGVALSGYCAAKGLEISGSAAAGVLAEDEKKFSSVLILEALPQTQCVYSFIIAVLIIIGVMGGKMTLERGAVSLTAGLVTGFAGISAIMQGKVAAAAIGAVAKNGRVGSKVLVFCLMPELAAILGFVTAILLLVSANVL